MYIHISWETRYQPTGWSLGYCDSCQQEGAVRLERIVRTLYLNGLIPLSKKDKGQAARCDFCRRWVEQVRDWQGIALDDWSPQEGVAELSKRLGVHPPVGVDSASDARLHSLLSAVQQSSSFTKVGLGPMGILSGCIVGVLVAVPLAKWLHQNQQAPARMDELGFMILLSLISLVPGAILGALVETVLRRERGAAARIREVYTNYPFDLYRLETLSQEYGRNVQKAVKLVIDEVPRDW
ncbi:MAG TPA: hypothetical protein VE999_07555 [Gemmataceae bacterium]|nr:hypothetical protein [Gemmataceae bacterium]